MQTRILGRSKSVPKLALVAGLCFVSTKVIVASTRVPIRSRPRRARRRVPGRWATATCT